MIRRMRSRFKSLSSKKGPNFDTKISKDTVVGVVVLFVLGMFAVGGFSGSITGYSVADSLNFSGVDVPDTESDVLDEPEMDVGEQPSQKEDACADGKCGLGSVGVRKKGGPVKELDVREEKSSLFVSSTPAHGETVGSLGDITVTASENIQPGSYIKLYKDNENTMVDRGYTTMSKNTMTTTSLVQEPGSYKAEYHILVNGGNAEDGQFSFEVA